MRAQPGGASDAVRDRVMRGAWRAGDRAARLHADPAFAPGIFRPAPHLFRAAGPIPQFRGWAQRFYVDGGPRGANR